MLRFLLLSKRVQLLTRQGKEFNIRDLVVAALDATPEYGAKVAEAIATAQQAQILQEGDVVVEQSDSEVIDLDNLPQDVDEDEQVEEIEGDESAVVVEDNSWDPVEEDAELTAAV